MEFSQRDMAILISMPLAIIVLNFAFSGIGMAEDSVNSTDIPEYNLPSDRFALSSQFPDYPGNPSTGTLTLKESGNNDNHYRWLYEETDLVYGIDIYRPVNTTNISAGIFKENITNYYETRKLLESEGDSVEISEYNYSVRFEYTNMQEAQEGNKYYVDYHIKDSPNANTGSFAERIPIVGGIISTGEELAQVVSWIGSIFSWFVKTIFEILLAMVLTIFEAISFAVNLVTWILTSYGNIVTNASGFASVFIVIPGLLLSLELLKVGFIVIHLLPTT